MAMRDASFEAYRALYAAGLINDNLLPARQDANDLAAKSQRMDNNISLIQASQTLDPRAPVAECQHQQSLQCHTLLKLNGTGRKTQCQRYVY
jgi:hypothetical protein